MNEVNQKIIQPTVDRCLADIQRVIAKYSINDAPGGMTELSTELTAQIDGAAKKAMVRANVKSYNYRALLIEGFDIVKNRIKLLEKCKDRSMLPISIDGRMYIDDIIEKMLGGKRENLSVVWETTEGKFRWDPYTTKLTKVSE
jgi:hypothetical protein